MDFLVYQLEKCPTTEKLHWQGYAEMKKPMRMKTAQQELGIMGAHMETRKGNAWDAFQYCIKEESAVEEVIHIHGTQPSKEHKGQGHRSDLETIAKEAIAGTKLTELDEKYPGIMLKFDRNVERMRQRHIKPRRHKTKVTCIFGESGIGKSFYVEKIETEMKAEAYWHPGERWFDGYQQEELVIMNDIGLGKFDREFLLNLFDRYPMMVPIKGGYAQFTSKQIVITTCTRPAWILEDPEFARRIEVFELTKDGLVPCQALPQA